MADWRTRAEINQDVVFFRYVPSDREKDMGLVHVWDLDKTYLETSFDFRGLVKAAFEKAFQKRNVPGARTLVQELVRTEQRVDRPFPIYFITASPPQIEEKIRMKLEIDGIRPYGSFFKDNLQNLKPSRFWRLTNHIGYKLQGLLQLRTRLRPDVQQILWGDDSESDAIIYSLYSDICSRRIPASEVIRILKAFRVVGDQIEVIFALQEMIPATDPVQRIYINLATDTDPDYYLKFGRRLIATSNSFEAALDLHQEGRFGISELVRVGQDLLTNYGYTHDEIGKSLSELIRRGVLKPEILTTLVQPLTDAGVLARRFSASSRGLRPLVHDTETDAWVPPAIDYLHDR